eukprot:TRINITY_DN7418_c0_g2_i3.p1 TRINITY_DN7418_c0_g2~~TRINITY_DN7418_c0_g2_i3.p1  ORF type:complete len:3496 (+),score=728.45 TRINITY_DN7418_c0_g2_i3:124-10611(+)
MLLRLAAVAALLVASFFSCALAVAVAVTDAAASADVASAAEALRADAADALAPRRMRREHGQLQRREERLRPEASAGHVRSGAVAATLSSGGVATLNADAADEGLGPPKWLSVRLPATSSFAVAAETEGEGGLYSLVSGKTPNGYPLWERKGGGRWLYSGLGGRWTLGGQFEKEMDFMCDSGIASSSRAHGGKWPHELGAGGWQLFDGVDWRVDGGVAVARPSAAANATRAGPAASLKAPAADAAKASPPVPESLAERAPARKADSRQQAAAASDLEQALRPPDISFPEKEPPPFDVDENLIRSLPAVNLGSINGTTFNLLRPKFLEERAFFYLDADGDGFVCDVDYPQGDEDDYRSLIDLTPFLYYKDHTIFSDFNNIITFKGLFFRVPAKGLLKKIVRKMPEVDWPDHYIWSSTRTMVGYHETLYNFDAQSVPVTFRDKQPLVIVLEYIPGVPKDREYNLSACGGPEGYPATDFRTEEKMKQGGWEFSNWKPLHRHEPKFEVAYADYYGYGEVRLTLRNHGNFELFYGNNVDSDEGKVEVYLVKLQRTTVLLGEQKGAMLQQSVSADFDDGDIVLVKSVGNATIVIHDIRFLCNPCGFQVDYDAAACEMTEPDPEWSNSSTKDCSQSLLGGDFTTYNWGNATHVRNDLVILFEEPTRLMQVRFYLDAGCREGNLYYYEERKHDWILIQSFGSPGNVTGAVFYSFFDTHLPMVPVRRLKFSKSNTTLCHQETREWFEGDAGVNPKSVMRMTGIQIFGCAAPSPPNIALLRPANASSLPGGITDYSISQFGPAFMTDGDGANGFVEDAGLGCTKTAENGSSIKVDLGRTRHVKTVVLVSSLEGGSDYSIHVGDAGDSSDPVCKDYVDMKETGGEPQVFECGLTDLQGRWISVHSEQQSIQLCETVAYAGDPEDEVYFPVYRQGICPCGEGGLLVAQLVNDSNVVDEDVDEDDAEEVEDDPRLQPFAGVRSKGDPTRPCRDACTAWDSCVAYQMNLTGGGCRLRYKEDFSNGLDPAWELIPNTCNVSRVCMRKTFGGAMPYLRSPGLCRRASFDEALLMATQTADERAEERMNATQKEADDANFSMWLKMSERGQKQADVENLLAQAEEFDRVAPMWKVPGILDTLRFGEELKDALNATGMNVTSLPNVTETNTGNSTTQTNETNASNGSNGSNETNVTRVAGPMHLKKAGYWTTGSQHNYYYAQATSVQQCKDFCDLHWVDCTGFTWMPNGTCVWFSGRCDVEANTTSNEDRIWTYEREQSRSCSAEECEALCGCMCSCPCTDCPCDHQKSCGKRKRTCCAVQGNAARGKPAVPSAAANGSFNLDIDAANNSCMILEESKNPTLQIDLGHAFRITNVWLQGNATSDIFDYQSKDLIIYVGFNGDTSDEVCGRGIEATKEGTWADCSQYSLQPEMIGRYITIYGQGWRKAMVLCGLMVIGYPDHKYIADGIKIDDTFNLVSPIMVDSKVYYKLNDLVNATVASRFLPFPDITVRDDNNLIVVGIYRMKVVPYDTLKNVLVHAHKLWQGYNGNEYWTSTLCKDTKEPRHVAAFEIWGVPYVANRSCLSTDDEFKSMAVELVDVLTAPANDLWVRGTPNEDCRHTCARNNAECDELGMRTALDKMHERSWKAKKMLTDLNIMGLAHGACMMVENGNGSYEEQALPFYDPVTSTCFALPIDDQAPDPKCLAVAPKSYERFCKCKVRDSDLRRAAVFSRTQETHIEKRKVAQNIPAFFDRNDFILDRVPEIWARGTLFALPYDQANDTVIYLETTTSSKVYVFAMNHSECGLGEDDSGWLRIDKTVQMEQFALKIEDSRVHVSVFERKHHGKVEGAVGENMTMEISLNVPCVAGVIVKEIMDEACADGSDDVVFVPGAVVGCDASWNSSGLAMAGKDCNEERGYYICDDARGTEALGLTRRTCEVNPPSGTFYASLNLQGCGKDAFNYSFVNNHDGVFNKFVSEGNGEWIQNANSSDEMKTPELFIRKPYLRAGGVLCCRDRSSERCGAGWRPSGFNCSGPNETEPLETETAILEHKYRNSMNPDTNLPKDRKYMYWRKDPDNSTWSYQVSGRFSDKQCVKLNQVEMYSTQSSTDCQRLCNQHRFCTAINFFIDVFSKPKFKRRCELLECGYPLPSPDYGKPECKGWAAFGLQKATSICPAVNRDSKLCRYGIGYCEYNFKFETNVYAKTCNETCGDYEMPCLDGHSIGKEACSPGASVGCFEAQQEQVCRCRVPALEVPPCTAPLCKMTELQCKAFVKNLFPEHLLCHVYHSYNEWYFNGEPTRVGFSVVKDIPCNNNTLVCAGGGTYGTLNEQIPLILKAINAGGRHPDAPFIPWREPCVYDQCAVIRVRGAGLKTVNGDYHPTHLDCKTMAAGEPNYGITLNGTRWTGFRSKENTDATIEWRWDDWLSATRGWNLVNNGTVTYIEAEPYPNRSMNLTNATWQMARPSKYLEPLPSVECVSWQLYEPMQNAEDGGGVFEPFNVGTLLWMDRPWRAPLDLPHQFHGGLLLSLPFESQGVYSFTTPVHAVVHIVYGCTAHIVAQTAKDLQDAREEVSIDSEEILYLMIKQQGYEKSALPFSYLPGTWCPGYRLSKRDLPVWRQSFMGGTTVGITIPQKASPIIFTTVASMAGGMTDFMSFGEGCLPVYLIDMPAYYYKGFFNLASQRAGASAFGSGSSGDCPSGRRGDARDLCDPDKPSMPGCFCTLNDELVGPEHAWISAGKIDNITFAGVRLRQKTRISAVRISNSANPLGFIVQKSFKRKGDDSWVFNASSEPMRGYAFPTRPVYAELWRQGLKLWSGNIVGENVQNKSYVIAWRVEGEGRTEELFQYKDVVFVPALHSLPDGMRIMHTEQTTEKDAFAFDFIMSSRDDLVAVKRGPLSYSGFVEFYAMSKDDNYATLRHSASTTMPYVMDRNAVTFLLGRLGNILVITRGAPGTGDTEVSSYERSSGFKKAVYTKRTPLGSTYGVENWQFMLDSKDNLLALEKGQTVRLCELTKASSYTRYAGSCKDLDDLKYSNSMDPAKLEDINKWDFVLDRHDNLLMIDRGPNTASDMTEVMRLLKRDEYKLKKTTKRMVTALPYTNFASTWLFMCNSRNELVVLNRGYGVGTGKAEMYVLGGSTFDDLRVNRSAMALNHSMGQEAQSCKKLRAGDGFIEFGDWRLGTLDNETLALEYRRGSWAQVFATGGTATRKRPGLFRRDYKNTSEIKYGDQFIQIGLFRLGMYDENTFVISHKGGQAIVMYKADGTMDVGPIYKYSLWRRTLYAVRDVSYGDGFIEVGNFRIGARGSTKFFDIAVKNGRISASYDEKGNAKEGGLSTREGTELYSIPLIECQLMQGAEGAGKYFYGSSNMKAMEKFELRDVMEAQQYRNGKLIWQGQMKMAYSREGIDGDDVCIDCDVRGSKLFNAHAGDFQFFDTIVFPDCMPRVSQEGIALDLQYTSADDPSFDLDNSSWCSLGRIHPYPSGFTYRAFSLAVEATAVRVITQHSSVMVDELQVFGL